MRSSRVYKQRYWLRIERRWFNTETGGKVDSMAADGGRLGNEIVGIWGIYF